jgi:hypothetical protein
MTCVPGYLSNPPRLQGLPDSAASHKRSRLNDSGRGGVRSSVYNVEFVRQLCREINAANGDAQKEKELLSLLSWSSLKTARKSESEWRSFSRGMATSSAMQGRQTSYHLDVLG